MLCFQQLKAFQSASILKQKTGDLSTIFVLFWRRQVRDDIQHVMIPPCANVWHFGRRCSLDKK